MTTRIRHISGMGALYEGTTRIPKVGYIIRVQEQAVLEREGRTRLRVSNLSITVASDPDYDLYPHVGRRLTLRLENGKEIPGAVISFTGVFLPNALPDGEF